jgi:phosphoribosylglycinamide formyltransferase 1
MKGSENQTIRLAILASGSGTNAANIIQYFKGHPGIDVAVVVSNRSDAYVLERAQKAGLPAVVIPAEKWNNEAYVSTILNKHHIGYIVLAGFLLKIPDWMVSSYTGRIINIHPALLPSFGGKGMYGMHVHRAVLASGAKQSGISIHLVNEHYDEGKILFQASIDIHPGESPESLATRIHQLEYRHYPREIERYILGKQKKTDSV